MGVLRNLLFTLVLLLCAPTLALSADIYINQAGTVGDTGADCTNAHSAAWFNANATGGNTYHLCGTFTGEAGSTMLTVPTGSIGNILTVLFEDDAVLTAPYWGGTYDGAINVKTKSYVTIDGGTNGLIKNTANGSALANQQDSKAVYVVDSSHIEIKNLTVQDIYNQCGAEEVCTDTGGARTSGIQVRGDSTNVLVHDNTVTAARAGIILSFMDCDTIDIYSNTISDTCWGIAAVGGTGILGDAATNVRIYGNDITGGSNWQKPTSYHSNGIVAWAPRGGDIFSPDIYNNYIHGNLGASATGYIYCTYGGGTGDTSTSCNIYNNILIKEGTTNWIIATGSDTSGHKIYNNTIIGDTTASGQGLYLSGTDLTIKNNIISTVKYAMTIVGGAAACLTASDNNLFYNINAGQASSMFGGDEFRDWEEWQALGFDLNSYYENPNLTGSYHLQSTSGNAIDKGATLDAAYNTDKDGNARGSGAAWDIGAYEYRVVPNISNFGTGAITITPNNAGAIAVTPY